MVRLRVSRLDLSARPELLADPRALEAYLEARLRLEPCAPVPGSLHSLDQEADPGFLVRAFSLRCPAGLAEPRVVVSELFLEEAPSHLHFAALAGPAAAEPPSATHLLAGDARRWTLADPSASPRSAGLLEWVALGVRHVATGLDHLLFVLLLVLGAASIRGVIGVVTGFTVGHSATLALAVLGRVRPDVPVIEALVGASIAVVAVENVWLSRRDPALLRSVPLGLALLGLAALGLGAGAGSATALFGLALFVASYFGLLARSPRPERLRFGVAALFGTVHGFAFSGALIEMRLDPASLAGALFGFNAGVEVAQLALVSAAWPLWRRMASRAARPFLFEAGSAGALAAGAFWLVARTFAAR
jgi:hypothetical protein